MAPRRIALGGRRLAGARLALRWLRPELGLAQLRLARIRLGPAALDPAAFGAGAAAPLRQDLEAQGGNLLRMAAGDKPVLGTGQNGVFGAIAGGQIEASNVDLTAQFSELIVTQRGYQASSQVISTANEMLQQLFDIRSRR